MISDDDAKQFFQDKLGKPAIYGGYGTLQISRGKSPQLWKDAPIGGCARHHVVFDRFGVIPEYCFDCYKVLVTPRTVVELFKLLIIFEKLTLPGDNTRKCMTEGRDDCSGAYKGFAYCRSIEEGKAVRDVVRKAVAGGISPDVHVKLKRGCSEFGSAHPRYSPAKPGVAVLKYDQTWKVHEDFVDKNFDFGNVADANVITTNTVANTYSPAEIFAMHYWLRYAATIGDTSYLDIAGCTVPPVPGLKRPSFTRTAPYRRQEGDPPTDRNRP